MGGIPLEKLWEPRAVNRLDGRSSHATLLDAGQTGQGDGYLAQFVCEEEQSVTLVLVGGLSACRV